VVPGRWFRPLFNSVATLARGVWCRTTTALVSAPASLLVAAAAAIGARLGLPAFVPLFELVEIDRALAAVGQSHV
jgi:hypothetical protein